ncbi:MAG: nicotinate-nucleotide adenylyltransferase [Acidobacteriia bacterium]|nr:nicotinate-nucleotide adenylyltransferase [Methyloceanibacter sp.]MCL6491894.1 nicotinate-nucleotide adenylyltransferase [Terriglobia bacterium]
MKERPADWAFPLPRFGDRRRIRVGVLGGSFNPAHAGHRHVASQMLRRLRLHQVWLLVSPGNPLKPVEGMDTLAHRLAAARRLVDGRRMIASAIEAAWGTRYTHATLMRLRRHFPRIKFVWLMGADNLIGLPRWQRWMDIARMLPFAVYPRPSYNYRALAGQAARRLRKWRRRFAEAGALAEASPPAWIFVPSSQHSASATALRAAARSPKKGESDHRTYTTHHAA